MKTVTKTFYVNNSCMEDLKNYRSFDYRYFSTSQSMDNENEIQISWQEPEKKIEITESDFDLIWNGSDEYTYYDIKRKFFGAEK